MHDDPPTEPISPQNEAFLQVLAHRTMLKVHILCIVRDAHLAEDTLSDATLAIVRSWEKFDHSKPFSAWARGVARNVALANLRKHKRTTLTLDESVLESLGTALDADGDEGDLEEKKHRLRDCLAKLPARNRELVQWRYFEEISYADIAQRTRRNLSALYMAFSRIHATLADCVKMTAPRH
jgi:RNA polymerase sigma-70 factor (ECF subfamily)